MPDVYGIVTEKIIAALDEGTVPWRKPWLMLAGEGHRNLESKRAYTGINQLLLQMEPYEQPWWITFPGAKRLGGSVRKGEKSTLVVFFKILKKKDEDDPTKTKSIPLLRYYRLFNVEQCDGLEDRIPEVEDAPELSFDPVAKCERVVKNYPRPAPHVKHGGNSAFYSPTSDVVGMPTREQFEGAESYYAVLFHELTHSTGHKDRLKREQHPGAMHSDSYSKEELVAEIGATMLSAHTGLDPDWDTRAAYIDHWRSSLSKDHRLIVTAANKAQKSCDFILGRNGDEKGDG